MLLDRYRKLLETGDLDGLRDLYAADAVIDANVPAWRFQREGRDEIREQYAQWLPKGPNHAVNSAITAQPSPKEITMKRIAQAHPGHTSCRGFGEVVAAEGKAQVIAPELRAIGPGNIDDVVRLVHLGGEFFGEEVPALCTT